MHRRRAHLGCVSTANEYGCKSQNNVIVVANFSYPPTFETYRMQKINGDLDVVKNKASDMEFMSLISSGLKIGAKEIVLLTFGILLVWIAVACLIAGSLMILEAIIVDAPFKATKFVSAP